MDSLPLRDSTTPAAPATRADSGTRRPARDTTVVPTEHRPAKDTTKPRADSIQARMGRDHGPISLEIGDSYTFTRDQYFATGALSLTDLLARIPGIMTIQTGWLESSQAVAYNGDLGRLRVFYDGIEMDELEGRQNGIVDLSAIPSWSLDRLTITRGANELRIDIRSWEYNKVRPYTQFDGYEGDLGTTLYRGFYAQRFYNGSGLQFAGERYNTADLHLGASGDRTTILGRYGFAKPLWSLDATLLRTSNTRSSEQQYLGDGDAIAPYAATNSLIYIRGAFGREGQGPFVQVVAASHVLKEKSPKTTLGATGGFPTDSADTTTSLSQYVVTAGFDKWGGRIRLIDRYREGDHQHYNSPSASFEYQTQLLSFSASAENDPYEGFKQVEAAARFQPLSFFAVSAAVGQRTADADRTNQPSSQSARLEAGVRLLGRVWVLGGVLTRDTSYLPAPTMYDSAFKNLPFGRTTGTTLSLNGPLLYGFSINAEGTHWATNTPYAPQYEFTGALRYYTQWLSKFPRKDFSFTFEPRMEYRGKVIYPGLAEGAGAPAYVIYSLMVQLQILRGVAYIEQRNMVGSFYEQVPGYLMPRRITMYGVRWYFFD